MLKGISPLFSPELLAALYRMGHGDEIVFADAHFPGHSVNAQVIRADGLLIEGLLDAVLPKGLQILDEDPDLYADMDALVEAGDWVVWQLTGQFARNACAAGFKGMWHKSEGYPSRNYLAAVDPALVDFFGRDANSTLKRLRELRPS